MKTKEKRNDSQEVSSRFQLQLSSDLVLPTPSLRGISSAIQFADPQSEGARRWEGTVGMYGDGKVSQLWRVVHPKDHHFS